MASSFGSLIGRVMFTSVFLLSAWQEFKEFGYNGGPATKSMEPKLHNILKQLRYDQTWIRVPEVETKFIVATGISFKGVGGLLFIKGSNLGAYLLVLHLAIVTPILYDSTNFIKFAQSMAFMGALMFFTCMNNKMSRRQLRGKAHKSKVW